MCAYEREQGRKITTEPHDSLTQASQLYVLALDPDCTHEPQNIIVWLFNRMHSPQHYVFHILFVGSIMLQMKRRTMKGPAQGWTLPLHSCRRRMVWYD